MSVYDKIERKKRDNERFKFDISNLAPTSSSSSLSSSSSSLFSSLASPASNTTFILPSHPKWFIKIPPAPPSSKSAEVFLNNGSTVNSKSKAFTLILAKLSARVDATRAACRRKKENVRILREEGMGRERGYLSFSSSSFLGFIISIFNIFFIILSTATSYSNKTKERKAARQ